MLLILDFRFVDEYLMDVLFKCAPPPLPNSNISWPLVSHKSTEQVIFKIFIIGQRVLSFLSILPNNFRGPKIGQNVYFKIYHSANRPIVRLQIEAFDQFIFGLHVLYSKQDHVVKSSSSCQYSLVY